LSELHASMTIDISYHKKKPVIVRRFPTRFEIKEQEKFPQRLVDEERFTSDNQVVIKIYNKQGRSFSKVTSGGLRDIKEINPSSVYITINTKYAEPKLNDDIVEITRKICKDHLEPCILFPSQYTTSCRIRNFQLNDIQAKTFFTEFVKQLERRIESYSVSEKEPEIDYSEYDICERCGAKMLKCDAQMIYNQEFGMELPYCPTCYEIFKRKMNEKGTDEGLKKEIVDQPVDITMSEELSGESKTEKWSVKTKIILITLTVVLVIISILIADEVLETI